MAKLTNKQKMDIIGNMLFIVDSREQKCKHITDYLDSIKVPYKVQKLDVGDYSFELPKYPELNLDNKIIVERKNGLSELAGNFTKGRNRFQNEFERLQKDQKIHLLVETATWKKIFNGTYRSSFTPNSYKASLLTYAIRYNCPVWFAETKESPEIIYKIMYYELKEILDNIK